MKYLADALWATTNRVLKMTAAEMDAIESLISERGFHYLVGGIATVCYECSAYFLNDGDHQASAWWHARGQILAKLSEPHAPDSTRRRVVN